MSATRSARGDFTTDDGIALQWYATVPDAPPRASLVVVHGLSDHARRYAAAADSLAQAGIATFSFDLRGHGRSPGPRGHAPSFERLVLDLSGFREFVAARVGPDLPAFVLGHSMGGLIVLRYVQQADRGLRGAILSAPWLATASPVPLWKRLPAAVLDRLAPAFPWPANLDATAMSDDPAAVRAYQEDPLIHGRISPRLFREATRAAGLVRMEPHLRVPAVLVLVPADDRIIDPGVTRALARDVTGAAVTLREWAPAGHELLQSTKRAEVTAVLRDWILDRLG